MKLLPKARSNDIVVQTLDGEVLIYDLKTDQAYCLNDTSAIIFNACDGITGFEELTRKYRFTDELIHFALDLLHKNNLLAEIEGGYQSIFSGMSRREVVKKIGFATSVAISLPYIMGAAAPTPTQAQSQSCIPDGGSCIFNGYRQSNCCYGLRCLDNSICQPCVGPGIDLPGTCIGDGCCQATPTSQLCCFQPVSQGGPANAQYCHCR